MLAAAKMNYNLPVRGGGKHLRWIVTKTMKILKKTLEVQEQKKIHYSRMNQ